MRRVAWVMLVAGLFGCEKPKPATVTVVQAWEHGGPRATTRPVASPTSRPIGDPGAANPSPSDGAPLAKVNGRALPREVVIGSLFEAHGLNMLQQQIALQLAIQAAEAAGVTISEADVDREYDQTLSAAAGDEAAALAVRERKQALIDLWLRRTGVSESELRLAMTRQAYLRKLAEPRVKVDEELLKSEFDRLHGERVEVRAIELASLRECERVLGRVRTGADFGELAATYSINEVTRAEGGLLPPFSRNDARLPDPLRAAAFDLRPGAVSRPVAYDGHYYILKLERVIPKSSQSWVLMRDVLERSVRSRLVAAEMDRLAGELLRDARIEIADPELRKQYERQRAAGKIAGPALR